MAGCAQPIASTSTSTSTQGSEIWISQKTTTLIHVRVTVLPALLKPYAVG